MNPTARSTNTKAYKLRFQILSVVAVVFFLGLVARLFQLQVLEGESFSRKAERNFIDTIDVPAPRGRVFAQGRELLTRDVPAYSVYVTARPRVSLPDKPNSRKRSIKRIPVEDREIETLAELIDFADGEDRERFVSRIKKLRDDKANGRYATSVRSNLSWEEYARIQTSRPLQGWVEIRESAIRDYPQKEVTAFITGYMREISPDELDKSQRLGYRPGDRVGKTGIERQWENYLRGRAGLRSRVVDARGIPVKEAPTHALEALPEPRDPIPGQDIYLSVDIDLQKLAYDAFGEKQAGGLVVIEVKTGRILSMVSVPSIDPNRWEQPISQADYSGWLNSPQKPFVDKTVQEIFFPGSTYKVVSALAMLEEAGFDPEEEIECVGYMDYGGRVHRDSHKHGIVSLEQAIVQSCNVYFWHLTINKNLSLGKMADMARRLGFGERTGLGINSEAKGIIPTEASESRQGRFQRGVLLNTAIGQGNVKATVLQVAVLYAALGNGGYVKTPTLVDRIETYDRKVVFDNSTAKHGDEPAINKFDLERIHRGLVGVVADEHGTAYGERLAGVAVAGKTGTAQVGKNRRKTAADDSFGWDTTKDHSWFAAYAPAEAPEIAVVALVAHGGAGSEAAAPIVMQVIDFYYDKTQPADRPRIRKTGLPPPLPGSKKNTLHGGRP